MDALSSHFGSGAIAGLSSCLLFQPLDVIKTRLQEQPKIIPVKANLARIRDISVHIMKNDGIIGFWRGCYPTILRNVPGSAAYFVALNQLKYTAIVARHRWPRSVWWNSIIVDEKTNKPTYLGNLIFGASARASVGFVFMPFTVLKVRFESSQYKYESMLGAIRRIWIQEGIVGFFRGSGATALRDAPYSGLYVALYEGLKQLLANVVGNDYQIFVNLTSGLGAGFAATSITQPFDLVKTRIQLDPQKYRNFIHAFGLVLRHEGISNLFTGMGPRLVRKSLSAAITWTIYEELSKLNSNHL